jgi:hypothetical protein
MRKATHNFKLPHSPTATQTTVYLIPPTATRKGEPVHVHIRGDKTFSLRLYGEEYKWFSRAFASEEICASTNCFQVVGTPGEVEFFEVVIAGDQDHKYKLVVRLSQLEGTYLLKRLMEARSPPE